MVAGAQAYRFINIADDFNYICVLIATATTISSDKNYNRVPINFDWL